jgi:hypothetical protein
MILDFYLCGSGDFAVVQPRRSDAVGKAGG